MGHNATAKTPGAGGLGHARVRGRKVVIDQSEGSPLNSKDGVTVAKAGSLEGRLRWFGAPAVAEFAAKTADTAGDGITTAAC